MMTFKSEDNGFCRVYFTRSATQADGSAATVLYCWQDDGYGGERHFRFYRCSRDGEPDYEVQGWGGVPAADMTPPTPGVTQIGRELNDWLLKRVAA